MAFWSKPPAVGLDIGSRYVKAVQLTKAKGGIELEKFGMADIYPHGERPNDPEARREATVAAIRTCMQQAGIKTDEVVTAVAGESIIVRYPEMPEMPVNELNEALKWEAEEHIPFSVEEVNIDSAVVGRTGEGPQARMQVLLVCARKDLINEHVALLGQADLAPSIVDVDAFAFLNCFDVNYDVGPDEVVGLINVGGDITTISVYVAGMPRFSRDISIGSGTVTSAVQQRLNISAGEAETLKLRRGIIAERPAATGTGQVGDTIRDTVASMTGGMEAQEEPTDGGGNSEQDAQADRAIRNSLGNLVAEIRRSTQFFENQSGGMSVQRLVIGGGGAGFKGFDAFLQTELGLAVEQLDPLVRIPVTGDVDAEKLRNNRNLLGVAVGLALRKVVD